MAHVLVIDDDPSLLRALRLGLSAGGNVVATAINGEQGLSLAATGSPDVIVLDLGLPDIDGLAVCKRIRQWSDVPILVLSAADGEDRKVAALDGGADDYMTKPFGMAELEARIRTALRHRQGGAEQQAPSEFTFGDLELDAAHHEARLAGVAIELTVKEFDVLFFLARHAGKVCTHQMILNAVWGQSYSREVQYLHAYIHRLRQKLASDPTIAIKTSPGIGYVLTTTSTAD
jgi:two-component system KDP operon response regulator KdpE